MPQALISFMRFLTPCRGIGMTTGRKSTSFDSGDCEEWSRPIPPPSTRGRGKKLVNNVLSIIHTPSPSQEGNQIQFIIHHSTLIIHFSPSHLLPSHFSHLTSPISLPTSHFPLLHYFTIHYFTTSPYNCITASPKIL